LVLWLRLFSIVSMKISDCKHQVEFNLSGFVGMKDHDFTSWSKLLLIQINQLSLTLMNESKFKLPDTLVMRTEIRNLLLIPIYQIYPQFDMDQGKAGRWEIVVDDNCDDNTIFIISKEGDLKSMFMPLINEPKNYSGYREITFLPKNHFSKEEVEEYEKKTRACIILKNNFINEQTTL